MDLIVLLIVNGLDGSISLQKGLIEYAYGLGKEVLQRAYSGVGAIQGIVNTVHEKHALGHRSGAVGKYLGSRVVGGEEREGPHGEGEGEREEGEGGVEDVEKVIDLGPARDRGLIKHVLDKADGELELNVGKHEDGDGSAHLWEYRNVPYGAETFRRADALDKVRHDGKRDADDDAENCSGEGEILAAAVVIAAAGVRATLTNSGTNARRLRFFQQQRGDLRPRGALLLIAGAVGIRLGPWYDDGLGDDGEVPLLGQVLLGQGHNFHHTAVADLGGPGDQILIAASVVTALEEVHEEQDVGVHVLGNVKGSAIDCPEQLKKAALLRVGPPRLVQGRQEGDEEQGRGENPHRDALSQAEVLPEWPL
mmetsp:Transcript_33420/g.93803  ORF Transcript_33420/g.93803 Transcript_33420/m.93803 type:complete len:365 (-) Transcript_33420:581-1675(-)